MTAHDCVPAKLACGKASLSTWLGISVCFSIQVNIKGLRNQLFHLTVSSFETMKWLFINLLIRQLKLTALKKDEGCFGNVSCNVCAIIEALRKLLE